MIRRALLNSDRGLAPRARRDIAAAVAAGRFTGPSLAEAWPFTAGRKPIPSMRPA
jgi:hypothetical protein